MTEDEAAVELLDAKAAYKADLTNPEAEARYKAATAQIQAIRAEVRAGRPMGILAETVDEETPEG